jgi:hypothetical protein
MIKDEVVTALETYTAQTNLFLNFVCSKYPELSEGEAIQLATETLRKLIQLLSEYEPPSKDTEA